MGFFDKAVDFARSSVTIDVQLQNVNDRLERLEGLLETTNGKIDQVVGEVHALSERVARLETTQGLERERIETMLERFALQVERFELRVSRQFPPSDSSS